METTSDQILLEMKTRGPIRTRDLAVRTRITRQAARAHLERLAADGLVRHVTARDGVGRPGQIWSLTEKGQQRFPDTHAQMTVELIEAVRGEFGDAGLDRLISRREHTLAVSYAAALEDAPTIGDKVALLTRLRSAEGYMAEVIGGTGGTFIIAENHCPICAAATACQGFCRSELALFSKLLAPARVTRFEHILSGSRRCAYLVSPPRG